MSKIDEIGKMCVDEIPFFSIVTRQNESYFFQTIPYAPPWGILGPG